MHLICKNEKEIYVATVEVAIGENLYAFIGETYILNLKSELHVLIIVLFL